MASNSPLAEGTKGSSDAEVSETVSKASGFKPTPQESFNVEVRDPAQAAPVTAMAKDPEMLPETVGGDKKPKSKRIVSSRNTALLSCLKTKKVVTELARALVFLLSTADAVFDVVNRE